MTRKVCVIEGDEASPEVVRPTVELLEGMKLDIAFLRPLTGRPAMDAVGNSFPPEVRVGR